MASNGLNTSEDAEMAECDGEKTVTMMDVLREQQDFEEDANAVLGASDDKNCTYAKGYVKRQAIYACLTCCPDAVSDTTKRAGVCLACSLACHENHELVELYTKRNFRCDCGNPKFTQPCQFTPNKTDLNYENKYNQNFSGIYCSCKRPYPDPEATEEEEMIQCIVCEDWLHTNHLEATVPSNEQYAEMICKDCMEDIDFLHDYSELVVNVEDKEIIVMDPDLDVSSIIKAKESPQKVLSNDPAEAESQKVLSNGLAEAESKDKDVTVPDTNESNLEDKQDEKTTDVEMSEPKPDEEGESTTDGDIGENKPDESGDGTNSSKENAEQDEHKTEASGDANPDTTTTETKENQEVDNSEKKNENNEPETNKESDDKENSGDQITPDESAEKTSESAEKTSESASEPKTTDDSTIAEPIEAERAKDKETTESETTDKEIAKAEADSVFDNKDDTIATNEDVPADAKPQDEEMKEDNSNNATSDKENELPTNKAEHKRKLSEGNIEVSPKKQKLESNPCVRPRGVKRVYKGATFWPTTLRQKLCTCAECLSMYKDLAVLFLIDPDDTVTAYETLGKINDGATSSQYEKGLQALSSLDRVQQINALTEYNKMRDKLLDFLKSIKDRKEIVKEEDIKAFFAGMKPKREPDGVYFCR